MRPIKFRDFDLEKGEMRYFPLEEYDDNFHDQYGNIMQFTGLKDKNGKEIYEDDIVIQEKWVSVGKYEKAKGIIKYKGVGFTCECHGDWLGSNADLNGNAEVIGNKFENPELLNA
jgi:uncharacterized phage protein (TIGR01671 family)